MNEPRNRTLFEKENVRSIWFGPTEIEILTRTLKDVLRILRLDRDDPATQIVAKRIIELASPGELDPVPAAGSCD